MRLASGTVVAQAISIAALPILTRLYTPEDFGVFVLFQAVAAMVGVVATGRYEFAILAADSESEAWAGVWLVSGVAAIIGVLSLFTVWIAFYISSNGILAENFLILAPLLAVLVTINGVYRAFYFWCNRKEKYGRLAVNKIISASAFAAVSIALGLMGFALIGLIVGTVVGQFTNSFLLIWQTLRERDRPLLPEMNEITQCASRRVNFPKFLIPSGILETTSAQLHVFMLSTIFGTAVTGSVGLYQKSVSVPVRTLGNAIRQVFRQRAAVELNRKGECLELFNRTVGVLVAIALPIALLMYVFAPTVFPWIFGDEWIEAGQFARVLAPMFFCSFVASPVSSLILIGERQKYDLFLQILLLVLTVSALLIGSRIGDAGLAVLLFGFAHCIKSIAELGITRRIAVGKS